MKKQACLDNRSFIGRPDMKINNLEFRYILQDEAAEAAGIEEICFPPNEACAREDMLTRAVEVPDLFLVAYDREKGVIAGFLNGIATDETAFRDEFFQDASLHDAAGANVMLLGLDVRPEYRKMGLATELVRRYAENEAEKGRERLVLTCLERLVPMYIKMGFTDLGISASAWGGEEWHEMEMRLTI